MIYISVYQCDNYEFMLDVPIFSWYVIKHGLNSFTVKLFYYKGDAMKQKKDLNLTIRELDELLTKFARQSNQRINLEKISKQQFLLLKLLYRYERTTVSELASKLGLSNSATTIALNRLVKMDFIIRERDEHDRRVVWIMLSDEAKPYIENVLKRRDQWFEKMLSNLSSDEINTLMSTIYKMTSTFEE